jgi:ACS family hexuronate transporter-like MFS transporter
MSADDAGRGGRYRWLVICTLLFAVTTINYMDRQVIGLLKPHIQNDLGWREIDYSNIVFFFTLAYAIGYPLTGRQLPAHVYHGLIGLSVCPAGDASACAEN